MSIDLRKLPKIDIKTFDKYSKINQKQMPQKCSLNQYSSFLECKFQSHQINGNNTIPINERKTNFSLMKQSLSESKCIIQYQNMSPHFFRKKFISLQLNPEQIKLSKQSKKFNKNQARQKIIFQTQKIYKKSLSTANIEMETRYSNWKPKKTKCKNLRNSLSQNRLLLPHETNQQISFFLKCRQKHPLLKMSVTSNKPL